MSTYGFKVGAPGDTVAIATLMQRRGSINEENYEGLAQYKIKDVELRPTNVAVNQPRRWTLALNTTLIGMNMPNKQALWFGNDDRAVGDGYTTMDLNADQFAKMIQGGLYVDPNNYLKRLKSSLVDQNFFRKSKLHLTTIKVPDTAQLISAGDFSQKRESGRMYLVGQDQEAYLNLTPEQLQNMPTNLLSLIDEQVTALQKDPLTKIAQTPIPERYRDDQHELETGLAGLRQAPAVQAFLQSVKHPKLSHVVQANTYQDTTTKVASGVTVNNNNDSNAPKPKKRPLGINNDISFGALDNDDESQMPKDTQSAQPTPQIDHQGPQTNQGQQSLADGNMNNNAGQDDQGLAVDVDTPIATGSETDYSDLMSQIDKLLPDDTTPSYAKKHHIYQDDFSQVAAQSQSQRQKRRQQVSNAESVVDQSKQESKVDNGLDF